MSKNNERPRGLKPIKKIELSEDKAKLRLVLVIVLLVVGFAAFGIFLYTLLTKDTGWYTISAETEYRNCGSDFKFNYYVGSTDTDPKIEYKDVTALYGELTVKGYRLFNRYETFVEVKNVCYINNHPNEVIEIDEDLYKAFEIMLSNENRYLYLGALYTEYSANFFGNTASPITEQNDPKQNDEFAKYFKTLAEYALDKTKVELELLGDNKVKLNVSDDYLDYAEENGIEVYIDFARAKNAFVIDMIADSLQKNGFVKGCISSYDGYIRNLDDSGEEYSLNLFAKMGETVYNTSAMTYNKAMSIITLRSYPMGELDLYDFMIKTDGSIITPYIDIKDGIYKTSCSELTVYSTEFGCAEMLMQVQWIYINDTLYIDALNDLSDIGIYSIFFDNRQIIANDSSLTLKNLYSDKEITYSVKYTK